MKNKLPDLNNHLFAQLERLSDETLSREQLENEVKRGRAIAAVASEITRGYSLQVEAARIVASHGDRFKKELNMITAKAEDPASPMIEGETSRP